MRTLAQLNRFFKKHNINPPTYENDYGEMQLVFSIPIDVNKPKQVQPPHKYSNEWYRWYNQQERNGIDLGFDIRQAIFCCGVKNQ